MAISEVLGKPFAERLWKRHAARGVASAVRRDMSHLRKWMGLCLLSTIAWSVGAAQHIEIHRWGDNCGGMTPQSVPGEVSRSSSVSYYHSDSTWSTTACYFGLILTAGQEAEISFSAVTGDADANLHVHVVPYRNPLDQNYAEYNQLCGIAARTFSDRKFTIAAGASSGEGRTYGISSGGSFVSTYDTVYICVSTSGGLGNVSKTIGFTITAKVYQKGSGPGGGGDSDGGETGGDGGSTADSPSPVKNLSANYISSRNWISLEWTGPADAVAYAISRRDVGSGVVERLQDAWGSPYYFDQNYIPERTYVYLISAINAKGKSSSAVASSQVTPRKNDTGQGEETEPSVTEYVITISDGLNGLISVPTRTYTKKSMSQEIAFQALERDGYVIASWSVSVGPFWQWEMPMVSQTSDGYKVRIPANAYGDFTISPEWKETGEPIREDPEAKPKNDDFSSASQIDERSGGWLALNVGATSQRGEPLLNVYPTAMTTVWWKWKAPASGSATVDTIGSDFDTQMGVYTGSSLTSLSLVDNDDNGGDNKSSVCTFACTKGTTYYICVGGNKGATGWISLNWDIWIAFEIADGELTKYNGAGGAVTIPEGVRSIGKGVFAGCSGLTSVTMPSSVTSIAPGAFDGNARLEKIVVDKDNPTYSSLDGILFDKAKTKLIRCPEGKTGSVKIPSGVASIGVKAFSWCGGMSSMEIPQTVTSIGDDAFLNCWSLKTVYVSPGDANRVARLYSFGSTVKFVEITESSQKVARAMVEDSGRTLRFVYDEAESMGSGGFSVADAETALMYPPWHDCHAKVTTVIFDDTFKDYQPKSCKRWFYGFTVLTTVEGCENLDTANVTDMAEMFSGCSSLGSIDLSGFDTANVTDMSSMFWSCASLKTIYVSDKFVTTQVKYSAYMFIFCSQLSGGEGTTCAIGGPTDKSYARIDGGKSNPGYFTEKVLPYVVVFVDDGMTSASMPSCTCELGVVYALPKCAFTKSGKAFKGWACSNGRRYDDGMLVFNLGRSGETVTMTAIWE